MDRDYTTEKESQCSELIEMLKTENNTLTFQHPFNEAYIPTFNVHNENYQSIYAQNYNYYESSFYQMMNVFEQVRKFDQTSAAGETIQEELNTLKETMQQVRELLKLPNIGTSASEVNYNLGRYGSDVALAGSIFGDCISYTDGVAVAGFREEAENSRAYLERELQNLMYVDENGNEIYNMELALEILSRDAKDISQAEYGAVAAAYLYMNDNELEKLFAVMMTATQGDEYTEWVIDDEKWNKFRTGLEKLSTYNLRKVQLDEKENVDTGKKKDSNKNEDSLDNRKNIIQRKAVLDALYNIHQFEQNTKDSSNPFDIKIYSEKIIISFQEYSYNSMFPAPHESSITIGECITAENLKYYIVDDTEMQLKNYFVPNFTSDGFTSKEEMQKFALQHLGNATFDAFVGQAIDNNMAAVALSFVEEGFSMEMEYQKGKRDAAYIQEVLNPIKQQDVYEKFDCLNVIIEYDTNSINEKDMYVEEGAKTRANVDSFNDVFGENITVDQVLGNPIEIFELLDGFKDESELLELWNRYRGETKK